VAEYFLNLLHSIGLPFIDSTVLFAVAVGMSMTLLVLLGLYAMRAVSNPVRRRVLQTTEGDEKRTSRASKIDRYLAPVKAFIVPTRSKELTAIRTRLVYAGYRGDEIVTVYYALKLLLLVVLAVVCGIALFFWPGSTSVGIIAAMAFGVSLGVVLPSYYLDRIIKARRAEIVNGFPDVLDLIVACTEAGLGLNDAIQRVSRETTLMFPVLSTELGLVNSQIRAGVDRVEALHGLAQRIGLEEINSFVSMVSQSVRFGTSIADTLRIFAEEFRDRRMQRAEEQAAKVGTKLIFPLVLCIFPSFFVVTIGPAVISIARVFEQLR
jgi:tight adherence protein C